MVQSRAPATLSVTIATLVVCTIFVFFRFLTRTWIVRKIQIDDWFILAAWLVAVGFSVSICIGTAYGLGLHSADIPRGSEVSLRKAEYAFSVLYNPALMLTKTSIIAFFLTLARNNPLFRWSNYLTLAVVNVAGLALTLLSLFQCRPISAGFLYPTPQAANCTDIVTLYLSSAPVNIITDLAILFLPMPTLTGMRLPRKQKIILVVTFSFGVFVTVVDIVRIAYLENAALNRLQAVGNNNGNARLVEQKDFPWYASLSFMWSAVEVNVGIVCACVPSLKPLFQRFLPSFIRSAGDVSMRGGSFEAGSLDAEKKGLADMPGLVLPRNRDAARALTNPAAFTKPSAAEYRGGGGDDELGFLDFLAGPPEEGPGTSPVRRTTSNISRFSRVPTRKSAAKSDFDFYDMGRPRTMLTLGNRESLMPVAIVTVIFFLWGFAYGLLNVLNSHFETIAKLSQPQSLGLHGAYYGGYFVGPLTLGRFMLKSYGFKSSMIAGLCVYSCGTLIFWPSAVLTSYTAFVISNFIVGFGLSCLEIAANPFIALCGPLEYAEVRLNFSQGFQAVGTVLSPLLAQKVFFKNVRDAGSLVNAQWAYLGIALFDVLLAVAFYYAPLPEASDDNLEELADRRSAAYRTKVGSVPVVWLTLGLGVFSQFCYVGGQEGIGGNVGSLDSLLRPNVLSSFDYITVGHTVFAVGRFVSALLNYIFKPRWILLFLYGGLIVTCALQMVLGGEAGVAMSQLIFFFESGIFSIIFAICMRGMGAHTKTASALMTAAISGGALFSPIQTVVSEAHSGQPYSKYSFCVPLAAFAFGSIFAIYLNVVPAARNQVDPVYERRDRQRNARKALISTSSGSDTASPKTQFGLAGILARRKKHKSEGPSTEHVERRGDDSSSSSSPAHWKENEKVEHVDMPKSPSPVRKIKDVPRTHESARQPSEEKRERPESAKKVGNYSEEDRIHQFSPHRSTVDESGAITAPDLAPWPDELADDKECEILFGKSISSAL
jgi:fucose permease